MCFDDKGIGSTVDIIDRIGEQPFNPLSIGRRPVNDFCFSYFLKGESGVEPGYLKRLIPVDGSGKDLRRSPGVRWHPFVIGTFMGTFSRLFYRMECHQQ